MATIKYEIELDETQVDLIVSAFASSYGYQENIKDAEGNDIPNPDTKIDFWRKQTARYWADVVQGYLRNQAIKQAEAALQAIEVNIGATLLS